LTFSRSQQKKIENQTKIGRLAAISNFCLILFISSQNSFCKTVRFLGPNPKFEFIEVIAIFFRGLSKKIMKLNIREFQIKLFNYLSIHFHIVKNFDLEKNGAEFISTNENSKKVLGNPQ